MTGPIPLHPGGARRTRSPGTRPSATSPGATLHHFRLEKLLAAGGMGEVHLGFDTSLNRAVAIKVIRPELAGMAGFLERFVREAQAQGQIAHSNVVQVYFIGEQAGTWFMAMELVDGGSLESFASQVPTATGEPAPAGKQTRAKRAWGLKWQDAVRHMTGLAEGLKEASRLNIIHRDIKPANILLDRFGLAHLADFGLATALHAAEPGLAVPAQKGGSQGAPLPKLTQVGADHGEPGLPLPGAGQRGAARSPERHLLPRRQLLRAAHSGHVTAVDAVDIPSAQAFHRDRRPEPILKLAPWLPRRFAAVVDRCLALDPADRYPDYDALLADLARAAPQVVVPATPLQRLLAWGIDLAPFAVVTRNTYQDLPLLGFALLTMWCALGLAFLEGTPGQWMMRLCLRTNSEAEVGLPRSLARFALQHGWLAFGAQTVSALYTSRSDAIATAFAIVAGVGCGLVSIAGSVTALFTARRQSLADLLTGTRVLVNVR